MGRFVLLPRRIHTIVHGAPGEEQMGQGEAEHCHYIHGDWCCYIQQGEEVREEFTN